MKGRQPSQSKLATAENVAECNVIDNVIVGFKEVYENLTLKTDVFFRYKKGIKQSFASEQLLLWAQSYQKLYRS